jgi:EamA domain-containing membrane protein RarD
MKINKNILIKVSFAIGFSISIYGAYLKISHIHGQVILMAIGVMAYLIFILIALNEIFSSPRINKSEKIMWTICLFLLGPITGFVYLLSGRKRIISISE